jgi:hypothetical protein
MEKTMIKLLYKPAGMLVSVPGGVLAGVIFKRVWKITAREDDAPQATDAQKGWREVLLAGPCRARPLPWSRPLSTAAPPRAPASSQASGLATKASRPERRRDHG